MDDSEFKLKLSQMRQELTNLKIAHERGLGVISFIRHTQNVGAYTGQSTFHYIVVTATAASDAVRPFYAQLELSNYKLFLDLYQTTVSDDKIIWKISTMSTNSFNVAVNATSEFTLNAVWSDS